MILWVGRKLTQSEDNVVTDYQPTIIMMYCMQCFVIGTGKTGN